MSTMLKQSHLQLTKWLTLGKLDREQKMIDAPITTAPVVNKIGVVLTAPASMIACFIWDSIIQTDL